MSLRLAASAHPTGRRVDLRATLDRSMSPGPVPDRPELRLVRRRLAFPTDADDGVVVVDLRDLFETPTEPWERLERFLFRTVNTPSADGTVEADVVFFFGTPLPSEPVVVRLRFFDPTTQSTVEELIDECSRVDRVVGAAPGWQSVETLEVFHTPGGGPEESAGVLEIFTTNDDPTIANRTVWTPAAGPTRTIEFDAQAHWKIDRTEASVLTFETRILDVDPGVSWLSLAVVQNEDTGTESWTLDVRDRGLDPYQHYYYAVFDLGAVEPTSATTTALATEDLDSPRRLFLRLPGAYQRADEPDPTHPTGAPGILRRFLAPVGHTLDLARSIARGTEERHDVYVARTDLLPHLARMIGWAPDLAAPTETQRRDIHTAPELFGTVGTIPNVKALVNRVTSWPSRVKEFVHNIFLTNVPEIIRLWELWEVRNDGTSWTPPAQRTITPKIDARPALALDGAGDLWLFWHSDRGGRRELWRQRLGGVDPAPVLARAGASDDTPEFFAVDQDPSAVWDGSQMWVFWSSNREGQWDIWARTYTGAPAANDPIRLTEHPAEDRSPAAVLVPGTPDRLWLFWSSRRRGPADIWSRVLDLSTGVWSDAERITDSPLRDDRPAATVDGAGRLWLFWTRDEGGRQVLYHRTHDGTSWVDPTTPALDVGHARDEAPTAVAWNAGVFLLWHSNHGGPWQIWGRQHDGVDWQPAARLSRSVQGNKEPAAVIDTAGDMRVVWRSQRRGRRFRSRTLDFNDLSMLGPMGTFDDFVHYTYDTAITDDDWYERGAVGLYLTPDTVVTSEIEAQIARLRTFVEPLRAIPVRYVWQTDDAGFDEEFLAESETADEWSDELV